MKKRNFTPVTLILLALFVACLAFSASAREITASGACGENVCWTLTEDGVFTVSGEGRMTDWNLNTNQCPWADCKAQITEVVIGSGVENVGAYSFAGCANLEKLSLPEGLTQIGRYAFKECAALSSVNVPKTLKSIGDWAFTGCTGITEVNVSDLGAWCAVTFGCDRSNPAYYSECLTFNGSVITELTVPDGVEIITSYAFYGNKKLTSVSIPVSLKCIEDYAFYRCDRLTALEIEDVAAWCSVQLGTYSKPSNCSLYLGGELVTALTVPEGVKEIAPFAFHNFAEIESVSFPEGLEKIGANAFFGCTGIKEIVIPESVTSIGQRAFAKCSAAQSITIRNNLVSLANYAFGDCTGVLRGSMGTNLSFSFIDGALTVSGEGKMRDFPQSAAPWYGLRMLVKSLTVEEGLLSVGKYAFAELWMKSVSLPASVSEIKDNAFIYCHDIDGVYISDLRAWCGIAFGTAESNPLQSGALLYVNGVLAESITVPDGVAEILPYAFYNCKSVKSVSLPASVQKVSDSAFYECENLERFEYANKNMYLSDQALTRCFALQGGSIGDALFWSLENGALTVWGEGEIPSFNYSDTYLVTPSNRLPPWYCRRASVTQLEIRDGVTKIGSFAFYKLMHLENVVLPQSVTGILSDAFSGCAALSEMVLPEKVGKISANAFSGCGFIALPALDGVTEIAKQAFSQCAKLKSAYIPDSVTKMGGGVFLGCNSLEELSVPFASNSAVTPPETDTQPFGVLFGRRLIPREDDVIQFRYPDDSAEASEAYYYCIPASLKSVTVRGGEICRGAFENCANIEHITLGDGVTKIGKGAFNCCISLKDINIPKNATALPDGAFTECRSLESVTVSPENACFASVDGVLFSGDQTALLLYPPMKDNETCVIPDTVKKLSPYAFSNSVHLKNVTLSPSVETVPKFCFYACGGLEEIVIPSGVKNIAMNAFDFCSSLKEVYLGCSVSLVHPDAFNGCSQLQKVTYCGTQEKWNGVSDLRSNRNLSKAELRFTDEGHVYAENVIPATCTEAGFTTCVCAFCGNAYTADPVEALGHVDQPIPAVAASCTEKGKTAGVKCGRCGVVLAAQTEIPALGHSYKNIVIPATRTENGKIVSECSNCGAIRSETMIAKASNVKISNNRFVYSGKVQKPTLTVKDCAGKAIDSKYYTVKWSNSSSKAVGKYTVTVTFKGNYSGTKKLTYTIVPKAVTGVKNASAAAKSIKLTWAKATGAKYYEVYGSTDGKTFKKIATVSTNSATVKKINGKALSAGKTYYFKVRAQDPTGKLIGNFSAVLKTGTLTAAPKIGKVTSTHAKTATVTWKKVTGASKYIVYKSTDNKSWTKATSTTKLTCTLSKLAAGKKIYVKLVAVNAYGRKSAASAVTSVNVKK